MNELKNCPFCGSEADVQNDFGVEYWAQCKNLQCGATDGTVHADPHAAAEFWNRRAPVERQAPEGMHDLVLEMLGTIALRDDDEAKAFAARYRAMLSAAPTGKGPEDTSVQGSAE